MADKSELKRKVRKLRKEHDKIAEENFDLVRALEEANARLQSDAAIIRDLVAVIDKLTDGVRDDTEEWCSDDRCKMKGEHLKGGTTCVRSEGDPFDGPVISP